MGSQHARIEEAAKAAWATRGVTSLKFDDAPEHERAYWRNVAANAIDAYEAAAPAVPSTPPDEDCMWCGGNGRLETYTESGVVDEWTDCVCVLLADRDRYREALARAQHLLKMGRAL